jgi:hypothetical protein
LVQLSEDIRAARRERVREIREERAVLPPLPEIPAIPPPAPEPVKAQLMIERGPAPRPRVWETDRVRERETIFETSRERRR